MRREKFITRFEEGKNLAFVSEVLSCLGFKQSTNKIVYQTIQKDHTSHILRQDTILEKLGGDNSIFLVLQKQTCSVGPENPRPGRNLFQRSRCATEISHRGSMLQFSFAMFCKVVEPKEILQLCRALQNEKMQS